MSEASSVGEILNKAKDEEKRYEWLKAADYYQEALNLVADSLRKGDISENLAYAVYKAAFQSEHNSEFKDKMGQALTRYAEARRLYETSEHVSKTARIARCDAMIAFAGYWLATTAAERRRSMEECWTQTRKALESFTAEDKWEFGRTFTQLFLSGYILGFLADDPDKQLTLGSEIIKYGEQAITSLSRPEDPFNLARAYVQTAILLELWGTNSLDPADQDRNEQKALSYAVKARHFSEEAALHECYYFLGADLDSDRIMADALKSLDYARKTRDKFAIGNAFAIMFTNEAEKTLTAQSSDKRAELLKKSLEYAENAIKEFDKLAWISLPCTLDFWPEARYITYFTCLASDETDLLKRRDLLEKAMESAPECLELAERSGSPNPKVIVRASLSRLYFCLANLETESEPKKKMLEQALQHRSESIRILERFSPASNFPIGSNRARLAEIKRQIADLTADPEERKNLLREALRLKQDALNLMSKDLKGVYKESRVTHAGYGNYQFEYAEMLSSLYKLTGEKEVSEKAMAGYREAAETFRNLDFASRSAECWWRYAQAHDVLGEYSKAAEAFATASKDFREATSKIPNLKDLYGELSAYMEAWKEIELGKHYHERQEYGPAENHFEKAASMHESSEHWSYLSPNYTAWARMEHAEELSRKGLEEKALEGFQQSFDLFDEAEKSIQKHLGNIESTDEKRMATDMLKAAESRKLYCQARDAIEEAKVLDKKGEHRSSAKQYGCAVEILEKLAQRLDSQSEIGECQFIAFLARAWQKMEEAEAEESPEHYSEAALLFEKAKDLGRSEKTKALMLGHSRFCKALEAGRKFVDTQDVTEYTQAIKQLESATSYYIKTDFQNAYEYAKATRLLFEAYVHMGNAAKEIDPEKRARDYMVAEKALDASAESYTKAGDNSRKEQALRLLEKAREQRELAISFAEVFRTPIVASTKAFSAPTPTSERAVGLERFEHAEVEANLMLSRNELTVGEDFEIEIGLANAGKGQALLNLIEGAFPEGFEVRAKPDAYRVEGCNINLKGQRLDPLKAEEVKLWLRPKHRGSFTIAPRIAYLDENGNAKTHRPDPITVRVREMGIRGWIKGEQ